ncbi:hypothetical protein ANN_04532 [Periplaneta americana]|uniref:Uncharacterized protein n=1 Tax=Periplaneta americana TaxID=6978 RepID=A0ABQ8TB78_PERAM|nr:hypothetical protein ANN_04532 [Periplaneta americana]
MAASFNCPKIGLNLTSDTKKAPLMRQLGQEIMRNQTTAELRRKGGDRLARRPPLTVIRPPEEREYAVGNGDGNDDDDDDDDDDEEYVLFLHIVTLRRVATLEKLLGLSLLLRGLIRDGSVHLGTVWLIVCPIHRYGDCPSPTDGLCGIRESDADRWTILTQPVLDPGPALWTSRLISPRGPELQTVPDQPTLIVGPSCLILPQSLTETGPVRMRIA